jgi:hypothetical protein
MTLSYDFQNCPIWVQDCPIWVQLCPKGVQLCPIWFQNCPIPYTRSIHTIISYITIEYKCIKEILF